VVVVLTGEEDEVAAGGGGSAESDIGTRAPMVGLDQRYGGRGVRRVAARGLTEEELTRGQKGGDSQWQRLL
jgi:hypothetical protein